MELFCDYRTKVALYPQWQKFLHDRQGEAYLNDLPRAEMHRLDSGHFAVEDCLEQIATNIQRFYDGKVASAAQTSPSRKAG